MPAKYNEGQALEGAIKKPAVYRAVRTVIFTWSISIEQAHYYGLGSMHNPRIGYLHLVYPFGHGVVIHLLDLVLVHHGFTHEFRPVTVNFG